MLRGLSFAGDGELQQSHLPLPKPIYVFDLVLTHGVRRIFRPPNTPFLSHQLGRTSFFFKYVLRRSLSPFLASLLLLYSASSAPALMSRSSGRSCAPSRHSSCLYPAVTFRLRWYSQLFGLPLHRFLQIIQKTLFRRVRGREGILHR